MKKIGKILYPLLYIVLSMFFYVITVIFSNSGESDLELMPLYIAVLAFWSIIVGGCFSYCYAKVYLRDEDNTPFLIYSVIIFSLFPIGWFLILISPILYALLLLWCGYLSYRGMKSAEKDSSEKSKKLWNKKYVKKETETPKDENTPQE